MEATANFESSPRDVNSHVRKPCVNPGCDQKRWDIDTKMNGCSLRLMRPILVLIILLSVGYQANSNEIALTFDDAPRKDGLIYTGDQRTGKMIEVLGRHGIQAAFFANSKSMTKSNGQARLKAYSQAGHVIANHTHSHLDINKAPVDQYIQDIADADRSLSQFQTFTRWLRFPFLREGQTVEVRDRVRQYLRSQSYTNGYVTVDNYDYFIDDLVQGALSTQKRVDMNKACEMLVDLMWDGIEFYDSVAKKHIGTVRHVLLMHENDVAAYCLDKLISHINRKNWKVISPVRAFSDPLLKGDPDTLYLNQGRVAAIAHAKTGIQYKSRWESTSALRTEFDRRGIVRAP